MAFFPGNDPLFAICNFSLTKWNHIFILQYDFFIPIIVAMSKTVKFAVSMPEEVFKELESLRLKTGWTRSQFIRDSVRAWKADFLEPSEVKEEVGEYKKEVSIDIIDPEEQRQRAIAAAGRFRSGINDLSSFHDKHLEDSYLKVAPKRNKKKTR